LIFNEKIKIESPHKQHYCSIRPTVMLSIFIPFFLTFTSINLRAIYYPISVPLNFYKNFKLPKYELVASILSTIHSIIISIASILYINNYIDNKTVLNTFIFSLAYYCSDIIYVFITKINVSEYTLHHSVIITVILYSIYLTQEYNIKSTESNFGLYYLSYSLLSEIAVIPLNVCWYLKNTSETYSKYTYIFWGVTLLVTYYFSRIINFTILIVDLINFEYYFVSVIVTPIIMLNYYWFCKLCIIFYKNIFLQKYNKFNE
jgi:hypothetical protein